MNAMKKLQIPFLTAMMLMVMASLTSCSSDNAETSTENDVTRPISFSAYAYQYSAASQAKAASGGTAVSAEQAAATRAGTTGNMNGISDLANNGFGVFAIATGTDTYASGVEAPDMMYNEIVTAKASGDSYSWTYDPLKYWPQGYMSFFAYAPYAEVAPATGIPTDNTDEGITALTSNTSTTAPAVSYALSPDGDNVDLLYASNSDGTAITDFTYQQPVKFYFHHALTKVGGALLNGETSGGLMVQLDVDQDGNITGGSQPESTKITVDSILLEQVGTCSSADATDIDRNVYTGGTLNLFTFAFTPGTTQAVGTDDASPVRHLIKVSGTNANGSLSESLAEPTSTNPAWNDIPTGVTTTAQNAYKEEKSPMLLIPAGTYPVLRVTISYTVRTQDSNLEIGYSQIRHTIIKEFVLGQPSQASKRYQLTLRIGVTSVKLDGSTDEWTLTNNSMIYDKTTQTWIPGPSIIEDDPSGDDEDYL
jgi:hypothetical protein